MNLEGIMLSEMSHIERQILYVFTYIRTLKQNRSKQVNEHKAETGSEIREQRLSEVRNVDSWVKQENRIKDIQPTNY